MKQNNFFKLLLLVFFNFFNLYATDYYVDPVNGKDSNNGTTANTAFSSLSRIDNLNLQPGDTVFFMEGTYSRPGQTLLTINESGTAANPITFTNYQNDTPVFEFDSWTGIDVIGGSSYLVFDGLTIKGARTKVNLEDAINQPGGCVANFEGNPEGLFNGTGLLIVGPNLLWSNAATNSVPHHITVNNCEIFDCTSSGVAFQQADYVTITNNKIYNNCWYTTYGTSGINFYQFVNTDGTTDFHNTVSNNLMYGNQLLVRQIAGGCAFHDGNGFIVDDFNHIQTGNYQDPSAGYEAYSAKTLITNNVSVENGGSGLHFFLSSNCFIYNNTVANNAFQNDGGNSNGEIRIGVCSDFEVKNNIFKSEYTVHSTTSNTNIDYTNNYQYGPDISNDLANCEDCIEDIEITFLNSDISSESPYITDFTSFVTNAGTNITEVTKDYLGLARPYNGVFDIGAYELYDCEVFTWYADMDNDGIGNENDTLLACEQPEGYVAESGDLCDNDSNKIIPGDCGCGTEEGTCVLCDAPTNWYADTDGDGYGDANDIISDCTQPDGYVDISGDNCPEDANKIVPGICGCNIAEDTCETPIVCESPEYQLTTAYAEAGTTVLFEGKAYQNSYYTQGDLPTDGGAWVLIEICTADPLDCSSIEIWSEIAIYPGQGYTVVYNERVYESKYYANLGTTPGEDDVWQIIGICESNDVTLSTDVISTFPGNTNDIFEVITYNIAGQSVLKQILKYNELDAFVTESNLSSGIYISRITNIRTGKSSTKKDMKY